MNRGKISNTCMGRPAGYSSSEEEDYKLFTDDSQYDDDFPTLGSVRLSQLSVGKSQHVAQSVARSGPPPNSAMCSTRDEGVSEEDNLGSKSEGKRRKGKRGKPGGNNDEDGDGLDWVEHFLKEHGICGSTTVHQNIPVETERENVAWTMEASRVWSENRKTMSSVLHRCWSEVVNPYVTTLFFIEHQSSFVGARKRLLQVVLKHFDEFLLNPAVSSKYRPCVDGSVRLRAFSQFVRELDSSDLYLDQFTRCFQLDRLDDATDVVVEIVNQMILRKLYFKRTQFFSHTKPMRRWLLSFLPTTPTDNTRWSSRAFDHTGVRADLDLKRAVAAATCIMTLRLQDSFSFREIGFPLLCHGHVSHLEKYVAFNAEQQLAFLQFIDSLLDREANLDLMICDYDIQKVRHELLTPKALHKLAIRLMKLYLIPEACCPNVSRIQAHKSLRYWFHQRHVEKDMDDERWEELIVSTVGSDVTLQLEVIDLFIDDLDFARAATWALRYRLPIDSLPQQIRSKVCIAYSTRMDQGGVGINGSGSSEAEEASATDDKYHRLDQSAVKIVWVDGLPAFSNFLIDIDQVEGPIGLDAEWRPTSTQILSTARMSILQLALADRVYILDMLALISLLHADGWKCFADVVFNSDRRIIVGYGIEEDIRKLQQSAPGLRQYMTAVRVLDLCFIHSAISSLCPEAFGSSRPEVADDKDLSRLTDLAISAPAGRNFRCAESCATPSVGDGTSFSAPHPGDVSSPTPSAKSDERGLSDLVRKCLGKQLDKRQQISDWERRPLRTNQLLYAALDAHCLLQVLSVLRALIVRHGLALDLERMSGARCIAHEQTKLERRQQNVRGGGGRAAGVGSELAVRNDGMTKLKPAQAMLQSTQPMLHPAQPMHQPMLHRAQPMHQPMLQPAQPMHQPARPMLHPAQPMNQPTQSCEERAGSFGIRPCELRVVCDSMLTGLGRQLRSCGVDTRLIDARDPHEKCALIALEDRRIILTAGAAFNTLRSRVPVDACYCVRAIRLGDQLNEVMREFNVKVTVDDIFSRCQVCNGDKYLQISPVVMREAWLHKRRTLGHLAPPLSHPVPPLSHSVSPLDPSLPPASAIPPDDRFDDLDLNTLRLPNGAPLLVENIRAVTRFNLVSVFYVCANCGRVYWEGSHRRNAQEQFAELTMEQGNEPEDDWS